MWPRQLSDIHLQTLWWGKTRSHCVRRTSCLETMWCGSSLGWEHTPSDAATTVVLPAPSCCGVTPLGLYGGCCCNADPIGRRNSTTQQHDATLQCVSTLEDNGTVLLPPCFRFGHTLRLLHVILRDVAATTQDPLKCAGPKARTNHEA